MENFVKDLLELIEKGEIITSDLVEHLYAQHELWEVCKEGDNWYGSNIFSYDDMLEESINNEWLSEDDEDLSTEKICDAFREHGYSVWRV